MTTPFPSPPRAPLAAEASVDASEPPSSGPAEQQTAEQQTAEQQTFAAEPAPSPSDAQHAAMAALGEEPGEAAAELPRVEPPAFPAAPDAGAEALPPPATPMAALPLGAEARPAPPMALPAAEAPVRAPGAPPAYSSASSSAAFAARTTTTPPLSARIEAAQARLVAAVPPRWIEVARERPVLWMVGAPVLLASLILLPLIALEPPRAEEPAEKTPVAAAAAPVAVPSIEPPAAAAAPAKEASQEAKLAELESKPLSSLSLEELLLLSDGRAARKRQDASALARKLKDEPGTIQDRAVQVELWRLASDPDTAHVALAAMAQSRTAVGADLLYEVWMSRSMPAATSELAKTLLQSEEVRAAASPALGAAVDLSRADSCEATQAALPRAQSDADRRSLAWLGKLNQRRGCGPKKGDDCYPCLRGDMKQVTAAINAAKKRTAPTYAR